MSVAKYSVGDIFIHRWDPSLRLKIIWVSFDKGVAMYTTQNQNMDRTEYLPSPVSETNLEKHYYLSPSNILTK
jgi:hypothetical protein